MSYRHKKSAYAAGPKELLGNVMKLGLISYELSETTTRQDAALKEKEIQREKPNSLPEDAKDSFDDVESEIVLPPMNEIENDLCDHYVLVREIEFEVEEVKEVFEKKKKGRNYVEFRADYDKA